MSESLPEFWLRGPVEGISPQLQPMAHALLQAREEVRGLVDELPAGCLWTRPGDLASAGFHLRHLTGVLDRLFTYARGEVLSADQLEALREESRAGGPEVSPADLLAAFERQVDDALGQLRTTDEALLDEPRYVGRKRLPSNVRGLLFHAAEHTMRHVGQLLVTVRVQR